ASVRRLLMEHKMHAQGKPGSEALSPAGTQGTDMPRHPAQEEWRAEFPYPWSEDEVVTRRDTLRCLLAGSGALFLGTGLLTLVGNLPSGAQVKAVPVAHVGELAEHAWKVFDFPDQYALGILINLPGKGLVAYSDVCTHLSCAVTYQRESKQL